jgi:hypothetical protein
LRFSSESFLNNESDSHPIQNNNKADINGADPNSNTIGRKLTKFKKFEQALPKKVFEERNYKHHHRTVAFNSPNRYKNADENLDMEDINDRIGVK